MITVNEPATPLAVVPGDVVGYMGDDEFIILNPVRDEERKFPPVLDLKSTAWGFQCVVENKQVVYFRQQVFFLHEIDRKWFYQPNGAGPLSPLDSHTFFEIIRQ